MNLAQMVEPFANRFPIRVLSERTGVGTSTLRAWERRYGLLQPERTPKGHRLYGEPDVQKVQRVLDLLEEGHALANIARLLGPSGESEAPDPTADAAGIWSDLVQETLAAVADFSHERIEAIYNEASALYPFELVTERLVLPVMVRLGEIWRDHPTGISEEHFYTAWLRNRLGARFHHAYGQATGPRVLLACLPGDHHDLGLMLFALPMMARGYRALYFGADLPLEQIEAVVQRAAVRAVVLSGRAQLHDATQRRLADLRGALGIPLFVGGRCSDQPLPLFEAAGGVRLGSRIGVALRLLQARLDVSKAGHARPRGGP